VEDYLLKPLKKNELLEVLQKILTRRDKASGLKQTIDTMSERIRSDSEKVRENLMRSVLLSAQDVDVLKQGRETVNHEFHCHFADNHFRSIVIKPDIAQNNEEDDTNTYSLLMKKACGIAVKELQAVYAEVLADITAEGLVCLVNGRVTDSVLTGTLSQMRKSIGGLSDIFHHIRTVIGVGPVASPDVGEIQASVEEAKRAALQRLLDETERIFFSNAIPKAKLIVHDILDTATRTQLIPVVEFYDVQAMTEILDGIEALFQERKKDMDGVLARDLCFELFGAFVQIRKNLGHEVSRQAETRFEAGFYRCQSGKTLFDFLRRTFGSFLEGWIQEQKGANSRPIRIAKQYIRENFREAITLEKMGNLVGFSAAYFSNLFKSETGTNFKQYLGEIRIEEAKRLIQETNLSIGSIAEAVGYSDIKHFTKLFKKHTGLSPAEYRKLYS
jgi:two-component system response regulator YesN